MAKTTKKSTRKNPVNGKKGGEVIIPSTIGAMAGAAIGGLAGLALGSETARKRLALAKDKAIRVTGELLENINVETEDAQEEASKVVKKVTKGKGKK